MYTSTRGDPKSLAMKNGLPYLSKELFWMAMQDISANTTLVSGHPWPKLREMIHEQVQKTRPQIYAVGAVMPTSTPPVHLSHLGKSAHFNPHKARQKIIRLFEENQPKNQILTDDACREQPHRLPLEHRLAEDLMLVVFNRTHEQQYAKLIVLVRQLAQSAQRPALPYLGCQILKLERGQVLNQHRDYHNHPDYPNHIMNFGNYMGGSSQMLREEAWHSYDKDNVWLSFDALKVTHRVTEVICGKWYSITLYTPGKLERLTPQDWDTLPSLDSQFICVI